MCGITGVLEFDGRAASDEVVRQMTTVLAHRGPDGEGVYAAGPVGLGHRRLAIIDLTSAGRQPMSNEDNSVWITFNGEIYNFLDIRRELEERGHTFRSATDTEVVVHAYEEWGTDCLRRFNGMFAFGLWDAHSRRLWLVRDRLGVKPLFYCLLPERLLFGSEIKSILRGPGVDRTLDYEALAYYLALNYTPAPYTLFGAIRQLLPGHYIIADETGHIEDREYWDIVYREPGPSDEHDYVEEFRALLEDAVRLRLISDVPFGAFLSGGLDSSSMTYWMSRHVDQVKTFSIGFGEASFDEVEHACTVAGAIGTDHHEQIVTADAATILPKLVWHAEEPTADSSMVAVYRLAEMTRKHVTMVLSGDGADEILAGYDTYQAHYLCRLYRFLPAWIRACLIAPVIRKLPASDAKVSWDFKMKRFVAGANLSPEDAHATWRMVFNAEARAELLSPARHEVGVKADAIDLYRAVFARTNARHPLDRMLYADARFYLPNDMLVKIDRMTMAHGLEARVPYLDYRLVEFLAGVPPYLKLKGFRHKKYLLKTAMRGRLPDSILKRAKEGFNVPNARWIKGELKTFVLDHLSPEAIRPLGLLDSNVVERLLCDHFEDRADNSHQIWCLLVLCLWHRQFVQGAS
ncbi:MAG: asparagine synthase (glutamine-hydrolyzing) [Anaerolineae bacterium]